MRSGLIFAFVLTSGIIALSLLLHAGNAAADTQSQRIYAAGDLILRADHIWIALWDLDVPDVGDAASNCAKNKISLKEGYTLALDGVYQKMIPATEGMGEGSVSIANFSVSRNNAGTNEGITGFEAALSITIIMAVYLIGWKRR